MSNHFTRQLRVELLAFVLFAYAFTWGLSWVTTWSPPAAIRLATAILLHYGPAVAALVVVAFSGGWRGVIRLLRPLVHWRVGVGWYLFVLLFPLSVRLVAVSLDVLLGGEWPLFFSASASSGVPSGVPPLLLLLPVFLGVLLQAGLAEEIGWRGFVLPRLQARHSALVSSLILGLVWTLWHYHPQIAPALLERGLLYPLAVLAMTVLMTWVYNSTGGSLLLIVLYHTASNTADWIVPTANIGGADIVSGARPFMLQLVLQGLAALIVVAVYRPRDLARRTRTQATPVPEPLPSSLI